MKKKKLKYMKDFEIKIKSWGSNMQFKLFKLLYIRVKLKGFQAILN